MLRPASRRAFHSSGVRVAQRVCLSEASPQLPVLTFDPTTDTVHVAFYGSDGSLTFEQTLDDT